MALSGGAVYCIAILASTIKGTHDVRLYRYQMPDVRSKCGGHTKVYKSFAKKAMRGELSCPKCDGFMMMDFSQMIMWD